MILRKTPPSKPAIFYCGPFSFGGAILLTPVRSRNYNGASRLAQITASGHNE